MFANHIGGLHRPVQILANTSIPFSRPPQGKTECKRIPPSPPVLGNLEAAFLHHDPRTAYGLHLTFTKSFQRKIVRFYC